VRLSVADNGPGVSAADKTRVFDKFFRGAAASTVPTGTGLGLAIAREIVGAHNGTLTVEDVVPHGARFILSLPSGSKKEVR
jgi:signal transduction histidine kinase